MLVFERETALLVFSQRFKKSGTDLLVKLKKYGLQSYVELSSSSNECYTCACESLRKKLTRLLKES